MDEKVLRNYLNDCGKEAELQVYKAHAFIRDLADVIRWMASVPKGLDEAEHIIKDTPDDVSEEHKRLKIHLLRCIGIARARHKDGDPVQTRFFIAKIENDWENLMHNKRIFDSINWGKEGGKKPKRKIWAEDVADFLNEEYPKMTKYEAWLMLPDSSQSLEREIDDVAYKIYRDGEDLIAVNIEAEKESFIKRETFFKKYYFKRK